MTVASSLTQENTFFIFRDNGVEVKILIEKGIIQVVTNHKLTPEEANYIRENILFIS